MELLTVRGSVTCLTVAALAGALTAERPKLGISAASLRCQLKLTPSSGEAVAHARPHAASDLGYRAGL